MIAQTFVVFVFVAAFVVRGNDDWSFESVDKNGDGVIDQDEYAQAVRLLLPSFERLDADSDGYITKEELLFPNNPPSNARFVREAFDLSDLDHDGKLSPGEYDQLVTDFVQDFARSAIENADHNGDGVLTRDEFNKTQGKI